MPDWDAETTLTLNQAEALAGLVIPNLGRPTWLGEGWDNWVVRFDDLLFRFPRRALGATLLEAELGVLQQLGSRLPLPIPQVVGQGEPTEDYPFVYAAYRYLPGKTACRAQPDRGALAEPLGRFLRALHAQKVKDPPQDILYRADMARRLPKLQALTDDPQVLSALEHLSQTPGWPDPPVLCHGDFYARHLLVENDELVGIIDWGDVHLGDPAVDLSIAWSFLPRSAHAAFAEAYGDIDPDTWNRARFKAIHYAIHLTRYGKAQGDEAALRIGQWAFATAL